MLSNNKDIIRVKKKVHTNTCMYAYEIILIIFLIYLTLSYKKKYVNKIHIDTHMHAYFSIILRYKYKQHMCVIM